jgi:K+-sensing histidine kinase KdpD
MMIGAAVLFPLVLSLVLVPFRTHFANSHAALGMVLVIVVVATFGNRAAGYAGTVSAALCFDYFLTRPYERLEITHRTDVVTTLLLLGIGVLVTEIAVRGRTYRLAAARRAGYLAGLFETTEAMSKGHSPSDLTRLVASELTTLLGLQTCRYQSGIAGIGDPARLRRDGQLVVDKRPWDVEAYGFPPNTEVELLVESHGALQGRFLMAPQPTSRPDTETRRIAVALAENFGNALVTS